MKRKMSCSRCARAIWTKKARCSVPPWTSRREPRRLPVTLRCRLLLASMTPYAIRST